MIDSDFTGGPRRDLTKYRITLAASLAALVLAGWMIQTAYRQHLEFLQNGDETGGHLQERGLIETQEGVKHE